MSFLPGRNVARFPRSARPAVGVALVLLALSASAQTHMSLEASEHRFVVPGPGEIELAVSGDGNEILLAVNGVRALDIPPSRQRLFRWETGVFVPIEGKDLPKGMHSSRDPSLAWTGKGKFYFATMGSASDGLIASSRHGHKFLFTARKMGKNRTLRPARCVPAGRCTSDQPHLAGDRRPGQDQIYIAWRNKRDDTDYFSMIGCSADGGKTWLRRSVERNLPPSQRRGDYPRATVGPDGFVYVISATARTNGDLLLQRFSPCNLGFQPRWTDSAGRSAPSRIGHFTGVKCEGSNTIAGLDRCNVGNILAGPTVAVDGNDPLRVFVAYADETSPGNHDVVLLSTDNVTSLSRNEEFPSRRVVNLEPRGERYHPWACATQGKVFVGWYDRRSRTGSHNDNTEYFVGGPDLGEVEVSDAIDRQCDSGWPGGGGKEEAAACSQQPQRAGFCLPCPFWAQAGTGGCPAPRASTPRCDLSHGGCPSGLSCLPPKDDKGRGKFGDYNGIACAQGRAYVAWASAAAPAGLPDVPGLSVYFARVDPIEIPAPPPPPPECKACRDERDSCMDGDPSSTRFCVQIYNQCRRRNGCR